MPRQRKPWEEYQAAAKPWEEYAQLEQSPMNVPAATEIRPTAKITPIQEPSLAQSLKGMLQRDPFVQAGIGVTKGGTQVVDTLGRWVEDIPRQIRERQIGPDVISSKFAGPPTPSRVSPLPQDTEPTNTLQKIGAFGAKAGIGAAATAASGGATLPGLIGAGALGTVTGGVLAATDTAETTPVVIGGLTGGLGAPAQAGLAKLVPSAQKKAAELIAKVIDPKGQEKQELAKVLPEIVKQKPFAWSSEALLNKFTKQADEIGDMYDDAIATFGRAKLPMNAIVNRLDTLKNNLKIGGKVVTKEAQQYFDELTRVQNEIRSIGPMAKLSDIRKLKQQFGDIVAGAQDHFFRALPADSRALAAQQGFYKLREAMIDAVPELKPLGKQLQIASTARDILTRGEVRKIAGAPRGLGAVGARGTLAYGLTTGDPKSFAMALIWKALDKVSSATPANLAAARVYTSFTNAVESGNIPIASLLAGQVLAETVK